MSTSVPSLPPSLDPDTPETIPAWKAEVNAKLRAHLTRSRAGQPVEQGTPAGAGPRLSGSSPAARAMASQVAARVAERYANAPSYREVLAARAIAAAEAAEQAVATAQQAHEAAQSLLSTVVAGPEAEQEVEQLVHSAGYGRAFFDEETHAELPGPGREAEQRETSITHPEPLPVRHAIPDRRPSDRGVSPEPRFPDPRLYPALDVVAEATVAPAQPLLSKLIEFPRELVAPRKPRPRLAEGPLVDEEADESSQLRIFEVRAGDVADSRQGLASSSVEAAGMREWHREPEEAHEAPEWHSIRLGEHPGPQAAEGARALPGEQPGGEPATQAAAERAVLGGSVQAPLHTAPIEDRLIAGLVDMSLVGLGFLLFVLLFAVSAGRLYADKSMLLAAGAALAGVYLAYQGMFMRYGTGTPGMRYAQVALCTFDDDNPTRKAMQARVAATLFAALPLGLGLVWALFDEDRLGWHDRMTRTYQRSYR